MTDQRAEFRKFAERCRDQAAETTAPDVRDLQLKLADIVEATAAEVESGDALLSALEEAVASLPTSDPAAGRQC
jgi:hypothetical protein